jgi:3-methyl-2-oxobutanoate hydroxymethyltransferase
MAGPLTRRITLSDLRAARDAGEKLAMLTCYDYTSARLMEQAGVPLLLVGDSAANVILGHDTTLPVSLEFMIQITAAVRRGAPHALLMADMPFGSYHGSTDRAVAAVCEMVQRTGCDAVKLEAAPSQLTAITELADAGVAVFAHLGLRPQSVGILGGYRFQGRTAAEAEAIVALAERMVAAGAAGLLLEAVPPPVSEAVVKTVAVPVIGCGAGPACCAHVVVSHDILGLNERPPRFAPPMGDARGPLVACFEQYVSAIVQGRYPAPEHVYEMPAGQREDFAVRRGRS